MNEMPAPSTNLNIEQYNKYGFFKSIKFILVVNSPSLIWLIIISIFGYVQNNKLNEYIQNNTTNNQQTIKQNFNVNQDNSPLVHENAQILNKVPSEFNQKDWFLDKFEEDNEGFYCPTDSKFPYWSLWSKEKYSTEFSFDVRFQIKNKNEKSSLLPTLVISFGEYNEKFKSPNKDKIYYRLSLFDEGKDFIRLYNSKNISSVTDRLKIVPDLKSQLVLKLTPQVITSSTGRISLNPIVSYFYESTDSAKNYDFASEKDFDIKINEPEIKALKSRVGIGVDKDSCIKINSIKVSAQ